MEHSTTLDKLPEQFIFPELLRDRVYYFPEQRRLTFKGFMTKCTYDELIALSSDLEYRRALEQLFVLSSEETLPRGQQAISLFIVSLCIGGSLILALAIAAVAARNASHRNEKAVDVRLINAAQAK